MRIDILRNLFKKENGTFDMDGAIIFCGQIAGECYDEEGFSHLENEKRSKTVVRVDNTLNNGHHSVYDHIMINFNMQNIPKFLAMILNNEKQYTTSEKSARYTPVVSINHMPVKQDGYIITEDEERLYNKWLDIFKVRINEKYGYIYNESKIQKLAQENARYLVTVLMPTQMIYSTTVRQINYIASWMIEYVESVEKLGGSEFENKLAKSMKEFCFELLRLNIIVPSLMQNEKERSFSLFGQNLDQVEIHFGDVYSTVYKGTFAQLAQAQRHRTLDYQMEFLNEKEYFVPPIIADDQMMVDEWLSDMNTVKNVTPQGEIVRISELGNYKNFILKCKERLCSCAQLEIMNQTKQTLLEYKKALEEANHPLASDIQNYSRGARCTFPDFTCTADCKFKDGKILKRTI